MAAELERLDAGLEQHALLRIQCAGFPRRDTEERRVETIHAVQHAGPARDHLAHGVGIRIVIGIDVPAVGGDFPNSIDALRGDAPETVDGVHAAGIAAAYADDGDRFARRTAVGVETCLQALDRGEGFPEQVFGFIHVRSYQLVASISARSRRATSSSPISSSVVSGSAAGAGTEVSSFKKRASRKPASARILG